MGYKELSERENWQTSTIEKAEAAEGHFEEVFEKYFEGTDYRVRTYPKEFKHIYMNVQLDQAVLDSIFTPDKPYKRHGIIPDFAIDNLKTGKSLFGDSKRQDGWVEGKKSSAGRGNVHERACKYFTPGLQQTLREFGKLEQNVLPFWIVLQGDITRDPKRVRELHHWFGDKKDHFYLWQNTSDDNGIIAHFNKLKHILD